METTIYDMFPGENDHIVVAKVIRKWRDPFHQTTHFIIADRTGSKIEVFISTHLVYPNDHIQEGERKRFSNFLVMRFPHYFVAVRSTLHACSMVFTAETIVEPSLVLSDKEFYDFVDFDSVLGRRGMTPNCSMDFIGVVSDASILQQVLNAQYQLLVGEPLVFLTFTLENALKTKLPCIATGRVARYINTIWTTTREYRPMCLLRNWSRIPQGGGGADVVCETLWSQIYLDDDFPHNEEEVQEEVKHLRRVFESSYAFD